MLSVVDGAPLTVGPTLAPWCTVTTVLSQYTSWAFSQRVMSRWAASVPRQGGDAFDSAAVESF